MPNLAMRQPASQFSSDGVDLSWPLGGEREVVAVPDEKMTLRIKRRVAEGQIVIVDDKPTKSAGEGEREYRLLTGEDARKHMAEPAGPVTRIVYAPAVADDQRMRQLEVHSVLTDSERYQEAQRAAVEAGEEAHAAIGKAQAQAEKDAEKAAKAAAKEETEADPLADRLRETSEANAEYQAEQEKAFNELEKARQELENDELKHFAARAKAHSEGPTTLLGGTVKVVASDTSDADKAFMVGEKARQELEAKVEKERQAKFKAAAKDAEDDLAAPLAGKTDPYVGSSAGGRRSDFGITSADKLSSRPEPTGKAKAEASESKPESKPAAKSETTKTTPESTTDPIVRAPNGKSSA